MPNALAALSTQMAAREFDEMSIDNDDDLVSYRIQDV
jgi:hypothetical protein